MKVVGGGTGTLGRACLQGKSKFIGQIVVNSCLEQLHYLTAINLI